MPDTPITAERVLHVASNRVRAKAVTSPTPDPNSDPNAPGGAGGVNPIIGYDFSGFTEVVWDVVITASTPTFTWVTYRYIEGAQKWIQQDTGAAATTDTTIEQTCDGDRVYLQLSALAGGTVQVHCRGVARGRR